MFNGVFSFIVQFYCVKFIQISKIKFIMSCFRSRVLWYKINFIDLVKNMKIFKYI